MEEVGIIERVIGLKEWCVIMVLVQKSNGKFRICVDLRKLNSVLNCVRFVLFILEDVVLKFVGVQYFFQFDVVSGFW